MKRSPAPAAPARLKTPLPMLLALAAWCVLLGWKLQTVQPLLFKVIAQFMSLDRFGPFHASWFFSNLFSTLKNLVLGSGFFLGAWGLGLWGLEKIAPAPRPRLEQGLLAVGLGLAAWMFFMFVMGVAGGFKFWVVAPVYAGWVANGAWALWRRRAGLRPAPGWWAGKNPPLADRMLRFLLWGIIAVVGVSANVPELFFDSLVYHLGVPSQWIIHGGFFSMPTVFFSNLPMNIEMLYTGALLLSDERLCRLLHAGLGVLAVLGVFALGRRWFGRKTGFWAAGIFALTPLVFFNALVSGVDVGAAFFALLALLAIFNVFFTETPGTRDVWLAGFLTGAALGCKYNTAFVLAPTLAVASGFAWWRTRNVKRLLMWMLKIGAGAALCLSPWLVKNAVVTGNPVYPFLYRVIPSRNLEPAKMQQQMDGFKEYGQRTWAQYLRQPWDLTFYYQTSNSFVGAVYLFLLPGWVVLGLAARRAPPMQNALLAAAGVSALVWSSQTQIARYLIPALPLFAILGAQALQKAERSSAAMGRTARFGLLTLAAMGLVNAMAIGFVNWDPWGVNLGLQDRDTYLNQKLLTSYYPVAQWANRQPGKIKIFAFGETRAYYFKQPVTTVTVYDANPLLQWLEAGPTAEAVWRRLRAEGYTHLYVHAPEASRTRGYEPYQWSPEAIARWQELMARYTQRRVLFGQQAVYEILAQPATARPVKKGRPLFSYSSEVNAQVGGAYNEAMILTGQGRWPEAEAAWRKIQDLAPEWEVPCTMLARLALQQRRLPEALAMYERAESLEDLDPSAYNDLGIVYWNFRRPADALRSLHRALEQDPSFEAARKNLAAMEAALKDLSKK